MTFGTFRGWALGFGVSGKGFRVVWPTSQGAGDLSGFKDGHP